MKVGYQIRYMWKFSFSTFPNSRKGFEYYRLKKGNSFTQFLGFLVQKKTRPTDRVLTYNSVYFKNNISRYLTKGQDSLSTSNSSLSTAYRILSK